MAAIGMAAPLLLERHLDQEHHVEPGLAPRLGGLRAGRPGPAGAALLDEVAEALAGEGRPLAILVEEEPLAPGPTASREGVPVVVDDRGAGSLPGRQDREHRRIALRRLVVEEDRVEGRQALLGDGKETSLGADQDMGIAGRQQRGALALPGLAVMEVAAQVAEQILEAHLGERPALLVADQQEELLRAEVRRLVGEVRVADHRHAGEAGLLGARIELVDLDGHVRDVGTHRGAVETPGVLPGDVEDLEAVFPGEPPGLGIPHHRHRGVDDPTVGVEARGLLLAGLGSGGQPGDDQHGGERSRCLHGPPRSSWGRSRAILGGCPSGPTMPSTARDGGGFREPSV
jgi:hypothetical protein